MMFTIGIHQIIKPNELDELCRETVTKSEEFFKANPKRKVAYVEIWTGKVVKVRRKHVEEDVNKVKYDYETKYYHLPELKDAWEGEGNKKTFLEWLKDMAENPTGTLQDSAKNYLSLIEENQ